MWTPHWGTGKDKMLEIGSVVRLKSSKNPMTITGIQILSSSKLAYCRYFDQQGIEQKTNVNIDALEEIPPKVLKRLQKEKNISGLKNLIKNSPIIIYCSIAIICYLSGFKTPSVIYEHTNQEVITKGSYITMDDFANKINNNYVLLDDYNQIIEENNKLKEHIINNQNREINKILEKISLLENKRNLSKNKLKEIRMNSRPLTSSSEGPKEVSEEENELLKEIKNIDSEILLLYKKL